MVPEKEKDEWDTLAEESLSNTSKEKTEGGMPVLLQVALFHSMYGAAAYRNSGYPTRDSVIPFKLFFAFMNCVQSTKSFEMIADIQSTTLGYATVQADKKEHGKINRIIEEFHDAAFGRG